MYALIDCNSFYANCEKLFQPQLRHKPVVVLSNNDGCVVARSDEAKAIGVKMGVPYFKVKDFCVANGITVFSSNYTLYADMSQRVMTTLEQLCPTVEIYSIDEAFLYLADYPVAMQDLHAYAERLKHTVERYTGIPVSVGIGSTKTLAKLANHAAKKHPATKGICVLTQPKWIDRLMEITDVCDVWGVGKRYAKRLNAMGIHTVKQLAQCERGKIRQHFGVVLERTCLELNGYSCLEIEQITDKKQIISSRSFSQRISKKESLIEAVCEHVAKAAVKLRQQNGLCRTLSVFAKNSPFNKSARYTPISGQYQFTTPTSDTRLMLTAATEVIQHIFIEGVDYAKAGVMLSDICSSSEVQFDLFDTLSNKSSTYNNSDALMHVLDNINQKSAIPVYFASQRIEKERLWEMRREFMSHHYTTCIDDIPIAK